ncbi:YveK family protein [Staphylococcus simulans]|uniref:YveK family protein n=1 Tax=Staphylococcus simulans TaxID=1286 RepID=UPI003F81E2C1
MEENNNFDFSKTLEIIKRNLKWLIILPIVGLLLSVVLTAFVAQPKFEAKSQVLIKKSDKGDLTMAEKFQADSQIVATYTDIAKSPRVLGKVAEEVGNDEDAKSIKEKVEVNNQPNSQVLNFTATAESEKDAKKIADASAEVFKQEVGDLSQDGGIDILSKSGDDVKEISSSIGKNAVVGFVAGFIIAVIVALIREFLKKTKTPASHTSKQQTQHTNQRRRTKREDLTQDDFETR